MPQLENYTESAGSKAITNSSNAVATILLPRLDSNVYAAQYSLYLPDKALLQRKLKEWIDEFNEKDN